MGLCENHVEMKIDKEEEWEREGTILGYPIPGGRRQALYVKVNFGALGEGNTMVQKSSQRGRSWGS